MLDMKRSNGDVDHTICKPVKSYSGFDAKRPGLFGYTPIGQDNDQCHNKHVKHACYAGMRTASYKTTRNGSGGGGGGIESGGNSSRATRHDLSYGAG
jgi:hypothetical protein